MKEKEFAAEPIENLIQQFADTCLGQDRALRSENVSAFKAQYWQMIAIDEELRRRGRDARLALLALYENSNMQVQLQAARLSLAVAPVAARQLIETISRSGRMPQAADARGTLRNLDEGIFKPD